MKTRCVKAFAGLAISLALGAMFLSGCELAAESHELHEAEVAAEHEDDDTAEHGGEAEEAGASHGESEHASHVIMVTSAVKQDVISTQPYVCQIRSCKHIEVRALERGYLQEVRVNEGQVVKRGDLMFQIIPTLYQSRLESEAAEAQRLQIALDNAKALNAKGIVSPQEIALKKAELAKAEAQVKLAQAELNFASITAPFDGLVDRQLHQLGSLIEEGEVLTTLSDNSLMWVYFNVPEARYFEYKAELTHPAGTEDPLRIELKLANGTIFPHAGKIGAIEADFNNTTGNIAFRADFPNPDGLLRNGQTGTILIHRALKDALIIPQRATFEILDKRYVYVVDQAGLVHQRDIHVQSEQDDIFVIDQGLSEGERIILEGIRQVRDGEKIKYEFRGPQDVFAKLKFHAE